MFELIQNDFIKTGICRYKDEYGNKLRMERTDNGFNAHIRFSNPNVCAKRLSIDIPITDPNMTGAYLSLQYLDNVKHEEDDVLNGIKYFTEIVQRWMNMLSIVNMEYSESPPDEKNKETFFKRKMFLLSEFEETKEAMETAFSQKKQQNTIHPLKNPIIN